MGTNYFGTFMLTTLLRDLLVMGGNEFEDAARVVTVSSMGHLLGDLDVHDLDLNANRKPYNPSYQYCASKAALIHFSNKLARTFRDNNENVASFSVHPGIIYEHIYLHRIAVIN